MSRARKALFALFFLGFASNIGGAGTMASFNASTTNAQSTFASGSIVLSNKNNLSGNTCFSNGTTATGAGTSTNLNENAACEALFPLPPAAKPGGAPTVINLDLTNEGNLPGNLTVAPALHNVPGGGTSTTCSNTNSTDTAYRGTGLLCERLQVMIQRYSDIGRATPVSCVYGDNDDGTTTTCDGLAVTHNLQTLTASAALPIVQLTANDGDLAAPEADVAFLRITIQMPDGAPFPGIVTSDNVYQGRVATFSLKWLLSQVG